MKITKAEPFELNVDDIAEMFAKASVAKSEEAMIAAENVLTAAIDAEAAVTRLAIAESVIPKF